MYCMRSVRAACNVNTATGLPAKQIPESTDYSPLVNIQTQWKLRMSAEPLLLPGAAYSGVGVRNACCLCSVPQEVECQLLFIIAIISIIIIILLLTFA